MLKIPRLVLTACVVILVILPFVFFALPERPLLIKPLKVVDTPRPVQNFKRVEFHDVYANFTKITYDTHYSGPKPSVLFLSSIGGSGSYGKDRNFEDLMNTLESQRQPDYDYSYAFLFASHEEFRNVDSRINRLMQPHMVNKVTLIYAPFLEKDLGFTRDERHRNYVQRKRRRNIARSRNFLLYNSLEDHEYTLFIDADVVDFAYNNTLDKFIKLDLDIIVPRISVGDITDYDKNSWRGPRAKPNDDDLRFMDENKWDEWDKKWTPHDDHNMWHFNHFAENKNGEKDSHEGDLDYYVPLDSVGGAVLYAKADVYRKGAMFTTSYVVGTEWTRHEGYDGIETEGLCYVARPMGFKCWGFPNLVAHHS